MNYELAFRNLHSSWRMDVRKIRPAVVQLLESMGVTQAEITWLFVGKERMARDNMKYLGHSGSTDVITLQYKQPAQTDILFGDVIICIDEAFLYAEEYHTTPQSEVLRYLVHSILHLQGYDDLTPPERSVMKRHENRWLKFLESLISDKVLLRKK